MGKSLRDFWNTVGVPLTQRPQRPLMFVYVYDVATFTFKDHRPLTDPLLKVLPRSEPRNVDAYHNPSAFCDIVPPLEDV